MVDDLLLLAVCLVQNATTFVFGVLARLLGIGLSLGDNLVGGALRITSSAPGFRRKPGA